MLTPLCVRLASETAKVTYNRSTTVMPIEKLFGMKKSDFFNVLVHIYAELTQADRFLADSAVCFVYTD